MRYVEYEASRAEPNVVVDGSPNESTVLCLSHWPGIPAPADELRDDLSAQMAFRYVDAALDLHGDADAVTNNHFDQDGLVGVFALVDPEQALVRRALLEDVAAAGDFGTYRDRRAVRISAVISAWALLAGGRDPYPEALVRLPALLDDAAPYRGLWEDEEERLRASEAAIESGRVRIEEDPALDIAVVVVDADLPATWGRRFTGQRFDGLHPMAVNNATDMSGLALLHGSTYRFTYRYETWVQYRSRPRRLRRALLPLARELTARDGVKWRADAVGALAPTLSHEGASHLSPHEFVSALRDHLSSAPAAWDPSQGRVHD